MNDQNFSLLKKIITSFFIVALLFSSVMLSSSFDNHPLIASQKKNVPPSIPESEYLTLLHARDSLKYKNILGNFHQLQFNDCKISVKNFIAIFNKDSRSDYTWEVGIYPGLSIGKDSLLSILSISNAHVIPSVESYYLLRKSSYTSIVLPASISVDTAKAYLRRYVNNVYVFSHKQQASQDTFKIARYYPWTEFLHLFADNIDHFEPLDSMTFNGYSISIEAGYITSAMSATFKNEYGDVMHNQTNNTLTGITSMFYLRNAGNIKMISSDATGGNFNYHQAVMEVGRPCPPRCGDGGGGISWSDL